MNKINKNNSQLISQSHVLFVSKHKIANLKTEVLSFKQASYSTVVSLASFMQYKFPNLPPPTNLSNSDLTAQNVQNDNLSYPEAHLTYNKMFQPWCDYLSELVTNQKAYQNEMTCYFYDNVSEEFILRLCQKPDVFQIFENDALTIQFLQLRQKGLFIENNQIKKTKNTTLKQIKKIALINFATSQLRNDLFLPKIHLVGLFTGIFYNEGDQWTVYNVLKSQYPSEQKYKSIDTVILSGSSLSVNNENSEVKNFVESLKNGIKINSNLKILGVCFGHQLIAKIFNVEIVQKNLLDGVHMINFNEELMKSIPYFANRKLQQNTFELSKYHTDFVTSVPENFNVLAQSPACLIESLISKDLKYLSFQFHPQYSAQYIKGLELRMQNYQISFKKSAYHDQIDIINHERSVRQIRQVMRDFLSWTIVQKQISQ